MAEREDQVKKGIYQIWFLMEILTGPGGPNPGFESSYLTLKPNSPNGERGFNGGEGGIRTPVTVARKSDFESDAFDHSATSPDGFCVGRERRGIVRDITYLRQAWRITELI